MSNLADCHRSVSEGTTNIVWPECQLSYVALFFEPCAILHGTNQEDANLI